jgi:hypothetical protein
MYQVRRGALVLQGIALLLPVMLWAAGCGLIADERRIVVAKLDGKNITRGMLDELIWDMPDKSRPKIRTRQDYLRVLNQYIDEQIKIPLGQEMAAKGEINVDRDAAREQFFKSSGDEEDQNRLMWNMPIPEPGQEDELMKVYGLRADDIRAMKNIIEQETDLIVEKLQGDQAVTLLSKRAFEAKELVLDEEALRMEYELSKENFKTFESLTILGLQFPTADPNSSAEASKVRERLNNGESFDDILNEYLRKDMRYGIESFIENNPSLERFRGFWQEASGAAVGDVLGPTFMPDYGRVRTNANGQQVQETVPESWIVFKVIEAKPEEIVPYEKAKNMVAGPVAFVAMLEKLREQHGVEIYEDKLRDPGGSDVDYFND